MVGLIGYTGTVGSHIKEQYFIDEFYNSKNIDTIVGKKFDLLFISGISAAKYLANKDPDQDKKNIDKLLNVLKTVHADRVVMISSVDVHHDDAYGKNRLYAEQEVSYMFDNIKIVRLPGLVGKYIKKNFIYDICHDKDLSYTSVNSAYEFMDMEDLHKFIDLAMISDGIIFEIRSEPVKTSEVCDYIGIDKNLLSNKEGIVYSHEGKSYYTKEQELEFIKKYVEEVSISNK